ncbi:hypothetical protein EJB05_10330 [Eragrostis curvula]|uniref:NB-ARC domain-containing protein n=1 Tax=Eragrostis curvula TaxID=38414 RepID=A0A5J9W4Y6_9POAL|nr:hypothetical protein EJB05_10330 [Eragrostis curvula]
MAATPTPAPCQVLGSCQARRRCTVAARDGSLRHLDESFRTITTFLSVDATLSAEQSCPLLSTGTLTSSGFEIGDILLQKQEELKNKTRPMATVVVSAYKGVIESVLAKLKELMTGDKCTNLIAGVSSKDIHFLRDELPAINALLKKLEDADELDLQAKNWRNQAREMAYDIEDCIDEFSNNVESVDAKASFLEKASHFLKTCRAHLETAWQIKELKCRLKEINGRRKRYKVEDCISNTTSVIVDPRISAFYKEAANLVGIDSPKRELAKMVMDEGKHLKVMSIVGFGGLGKTTLASQVYREVGGQFNCNKAFVSVSQKPDMVRLLTSVLLQLKQHPPSHACGVQDLINILREYLLDKR